MSAAKQKSVTVCTLGSSGAGKTQIIMRGCKNEFTTSFVSTIGIDYCIKMMRHKEVDYKMKVWDTAGQERFSSINCLYYRHANGIFCVIGADNDDTIIDMRKWIGCLDRDVGLHNISILLVVNKIDLEPEYDLSKIGKVKNNMIDIEYEYTIDAKRCKGVISLPFVITSAKTGLNIDKAYEILLSNIITKGIKEDTIKVLHVHKESKSCCK